MSGINPSILPPAQYVPGRQYAIDHAGGIDKKPFLITTGILFGFAMLSVLARFSIRIFGGRKIQWDDGLVLLSSLCLMIAFGVCHKLLNTFYLVEALNKQLTIPFREEFPHILDVAKWAFIFSSFNWTSIYLVKFTFMSFFHILTLGMSKRIMRYFWATVGILVVCYVYSVLNFAVICPHFGADVAKCNENPNFHKRSVAGNVTVAVLDIICDVLVVSIPIIIVRQSMMPFSQKLSVVALLGLSTVMIVCALIRLVGSLTDTTKSASGTAPVWAAYWFMVESCVSLIMASVIVIRGVFITNSEHDDRRKQDSIFQQFGRRILSTLKLSRYSRSSRRSPQQSDPQKDQSKEPNAPRIATQKLPGGTLNSVRTFIRGGKMHSRTQDDDDVLLSVDTAHVLEDMDYHEMRKAEVTKHKP